MTLRRFALPVFLLLSACVPMVPAETASRAMISDSSLPPMKSFGRHTPASVERSNTDLARDFLDLSFALESGRALPTFTRFEGPITVRVTGDAPPSLGPDLALLLHRMRTEAGIDIRRTSGTANITIQAVPRARIRGALSQAACFVVPNITDISQYRRYRRSARTDWGALTQRDKLAIFVPNDTSPQDIRDCLHEELAQAIGPLNDLYRLPNSVFNDDNVHTVLTGFDMMILRAYYAPELRSGMSRGQVAARLPAILARLNPGGIGRGNLASSATPRAWADAVQTALGPGATPTARRRATSQALSIASQNGWQDHRRAFSHYIHARLVQSSDADAAIAHLRAADRIYAATSDTKLHRAYVATQLAAHAISVGRGDDALRLTAPHLSTAMQHENAALLATLQLLRAEAFDLTGNPDKARAVRLDSLGWARYGFGSDWAVRSKLREVAALNPQRKLGG